MLRPNNSELRKLRPTVVHFSGRGGHLVPSGHHAGGMPSLDVVGEDRRDCDAPRDGLYFQGPDGQARWVSPQALQDTFGAAGSSVQVVVLDVCYSAIQAEALLAHVDCVVGMRGTVHDDAARSFAIGFYGGLGERESIAAAYPAGLRCDQSGGPPRRRAAAACRARRHRCQSAGAGREPSCKLSVAAPVVYLRYQPKIGPTVKPTDCCVGPNVRP